MNTYHKTVDIESAITRGQLDRMDRRRLLILAGSTGAALAGAGALIASANQGSDPKRASDPGRPALAHAAHQEATPDPAAPRVGERPDGTRLWRVRVGGMDMENKLDIHAFLPGEITVNAGDSVWFAFEPMPGFHTVTFAPGGAFPPVIIPDATATPGAGGPPAMIFNPEVMFPAGGDTFDGTAYLNSGADIMRDPSTPPFVVTFTRPGTYEYACMPHQLVMKGTIVVQEAGSELPYDQAAYDELAEEQFTALIEEGKATAERYAEAVATRREDGTTLWELSDGAGEGQVRVMRILPERLEIQTGDTVRWVNRSPGEPHTVTFLGGEEAPETLLVEPQPAGPPKFIVNDLAFLPQGDDVFDGTSFTNSGFLDSATGPDTYELTFTMPGEFAYSCILHSGADGSGMAATLTVKPRQ